MKFHVATSLILPFCLITGCQIGTGGKDVPAVVLPASFSTGNTKWKRTSEPKLYTDAKWWSVFNDATLHQIASQTAGQNLSLEAAAARLEEARSLSKSARLALIPSLNLNPSGVRSEVVIPVSPTPLRNEQYSLPLELSYEVDMWGRLRKQVAAADARTAAVQGSLYATRLSLTADAAQNYWSLRGIDADIALVVESIALRKETLSLIESRFKAGTVTALDVSRAQSEVASTEAELVGLQRDRALLVNALAVVSGNAAGKFSLTPQTDLPKPPRIPAGMPSELLLRRPDLFLSERNVAAANADIGVSKAAFFPSFRLQATGGPNAFNLTDLLRAETIIYSLGYSISYPILGQKNLIAQKDAAVARHKAASAEYKQSILIALRETEDALQALHLLEQQEQKQENAVAAANQTLELSKQRFSAGLISFLDVVEAERQSLASKRLASNLRTQRLVITCNLIKALGGSW